jgi:uncharacterized RDD family membrane protein YckC
MAVTAPKSRPFRSTEHKTREIATPEGVPITVELATISERGGAFVLDVIFWNIAVFLIVTPIFFLLSTRANTAVVIGLATFVSFIIRNTYFLHFELAWRGTTPGKRIIGLRVIDRHGGPLLPAAVIARNLTREFEVFMPLAVLLSLGGAASGQWSQWLSAVWLLVIGAIPFLNADRMRGGDLIAGTIVIALPRQALLADQAQDQFNYTFTHRELSAYGAYELQVLEQVLRNAKTADLSRDMMREIGGRIRRKIGWQGEVPPHMEERFLRDFYTAERAFLEREQLFGKTKADKHDQSNGAS